MTGNGGGARVAPGSLGWTFLSLHGRIGRQAFWLGNLVIVMVGLVLDFGILGSIPKSVIPHSGTNRLGPFGPLVVDLVVLYPVVCVQGKRWHDRGKSAWWWLVGLIPFVGLFWIVIECGCLPGTDGANGFGQGPSRTPFG